MVMYQVFRPLGVNVPVPGTITPPKLGVWIMYHAKLKRHPPNDNVPTFEYENWP